MKKHWTRRMMTTLVTLVIVLNTASVFAVETNEKNTLENALRTNAVRIVGSSDEDINMYHSRNIDWTAFYTATPEKYDMRDAGVIPAIRNQGMWGTCWGFASIAGSETAITETLNLTTDQYEEKYGTALDLSEKHLAWFAASHLPEAVEGEEYLFPQYASQAGEGYYTIDESNSGHYNAGGMMMFAASLFALNEGPRTEAEYPYEAADGTSSTAADWSLPESARFGSSYRLTNSRVLPSPAMRDEDGNYTYNAWGTAAIKDELLKGRAVTIAYHADQAMDPDAQMAMLRDQLKILIESSGDIATDREIDLLVKMMTDAELTDEEELTQEETERIMELMFILIGAMVNQSSEDFEELVDKETAEPTATPADDANETEGDDSAVVEGFESYITEFEAEKNAQPTEKEQQEKKIEARTMAAKLGIDYDKYAEMFRVSQEADAKVYINTDTYAQYTDDVHASVNHGVTIIGWDDNYSVDNFPADHRPPANGAWIVRNSWGEKYGNDGYFYLSYYDVSISGVETFEFEVKNGAEAAVDETVLAYDFMPTVYVNSVQVSDRIPMVNVFTMANDYVLTDVGVLTAEAMTQVTLGVYLLNEDATSPIDGILLDTWTDTYLYAGYHRIALHQGYSVPAGSKVSVLQLQRVEDGDSHCYTIPYTVSNNKEYVDVWNIFAAKEQQQKGWFESRVNKGESLMYLDGEWVDWMEILGDIQQEGTASYYLSYDNLNIKLYASPAEQLIALHNMSEPVLYNGVHACVCSDCGYAIVEQD